MNYVYQDKLYIVSLVLLLVGILFFGSISFVSAAELSFSATQNTIGVGQKMEIVVHLNSEGETINAVKGIVTIPPFFTVTEIKTQKSLLQFWAERPTAIDNTIQFSGITPGGWIGTSGELFSIVVEAIDQSRNVVTARDVQVLLHDGHGTEVFTVMRPLSLGASSEIPLFEFVESSPDTEPPERFTVTLGQNPTVFDGEYFVVFEARDKQSGIDYYEVRESKKRLRDERIGDWERVESPYKLVDQSLNSFVYVRAVDRSGNVRVSVWEPEQPRDTFATSTNLTILLLVMLLIVLYISKRKWLPYLMKNISSKNKE